MVKFAAVIISAAIFAALMGSSGIAPSFCAPYGAGFLRRSTAMILYSVFVVLGAIILGHRVARTLSGGIIPSGVGGHNVINTGVFLVIMFSAITSLAVANFLKIPQSTSWVTVFSLIAAGLHFGSLNLSKIFFIFGAWVILPLMAYLVSLYIHGKIYPPRSENLRLYEMIFSNEKNLKAATIIISCYVAFSIGTNNVANVSGPLKASGVVDNTFAALLLMSPLFGLGAALLGKGNLESSGRCIAPVGTATSLVVNFVTASFIVCASLAGVPQSLVQLNTASLMAVSHVKNGFHYTLAAPHTRRTFFVWLVTPAIAFLLTFLILRITGAGL